MTKPSTNVLIVDDESAIRRALLITLGALGFVVGEASTGEQALGLIQNVRYDAVLLDINMPGMGGMSACREIRQAAPDLAILMLTVRDSSDDIVEALEAGADDYVTKPFHMGELTGRLRAAVRRMNMVKHEPGKSITIGEIKLNQASRTVSKAGTRIHLTPKEFELLEYLMTNAGIPLAHDRLLHAVWGPEYGGETEYLRTLVYQLRRKLEDDSSRPGYLLTETWFGYRFRDAE